ncbi:tyrosine-type recombinase/integrase [Brevibacillus agri]|uniref:tyrosine-type recombinase/integrase n=1 Tax=Brevibacillus agri TaxID=51101 RepID=UPI003D230386
MNNRHLNSPFSPIYKEPMSSTMTTLRSVTPTGSFPDSNSSISSFPSTMMTGASGFCFFSSPTLVWRGFGAYISPQKMTLTAFVGEWREKYASDHLAHKTLNLYLACLNSRILPILGHMRLEDIKPIHIIDFIQEISKDGGRMDQKQGKLSSGSVEYHLRVLKNILKRAVEWKIISNNLADGVQKPKVEYKKVMPYDEKEVQKLLQALQTEPFHWRMMVTLALTTGLRRGELLGLEWKHIDLESGIISVEQTLALSLKGVVIVKEPKTKSSKRKVAVPPTVLAELREYKKHIHEQIAIMGDLWQGGERFFVFAHPDGKPFHHERPYLWFRNFLEKNGLRYIRFHDLRHTSATLLINQGVHAKVISERLGHSNIGTTMNIYGHALQSADQAAADKFESLFTPEPKKQNIP